MRAAESGEQTLHRQQNDREYKASMRAGESNEKDPFISHFSDMFVNNKQTNTHLLMKQ